MTQYIWAFPGMGKSRLSREQGGVDADCRSFQFLLNGGKADILHGETKSIGPNPDYPNNYISYVKALQSELVFLNCHPSLLNSFEDVILIYPAEQLKQEYLERYRNRGNQENFVAYMEEEFEGMIAYLDQLDGRRYKVIREKQYLSDVLKEVGVQNMFMKKSVMSDLIWEAKLLYKSGDYQAVHCNLLDQYHLDNIEDVDAFCQQLFEGEVVLDLDMLKRDLERTRAGIAKELHLKERRGGLTSEELADKIMDGIVNGALGVRYAEIAPYSHGYEVTFGGNGPVGSTREFENRWECYTDFFDIGRIVAAKIENDVQSNRVFGATCKELNIHKILEAIEQKEKEKLDGFTPEAETNFMRKSYPRTVATVMDVHAGKGLDGIVQHYFHGDYSTMTPVRQNSMVEMLVCLKGFCLDCLPGLDCSAENKENIVQYLKRKGLDISTPEKLNTWIHENPNKCALSHNRLRGKDLDSWLASVKKEQEQEQKKHGLDEKQKPGFDLER